MERGSPTAFAKFDIWTGYANGIKPIFLMHCKRDQKLRFGFK
jgi:hypothetical protein